MTTVQINIPDQKVAALEAYVEAQGLTLEQWFLQVAEQATVGAPEAYAPDIEPARRQHISEVIRDIWSDPMRRARSCRSMGPHR